jgi:3-hydroxyisobutyrate dehydrogenase
MHNTKIGFIGLGNVGGKLAGSLLRHGIPLTVRDLNADVEAAFVKRGASKASSPREMAEKTDVVITCCLRRRPQRMSWSAPTASWPG